MTCRYHSRLNVNSSRACFLWLILCLAFSSLSSAQSSSPGRKATSTTGGNDAAIRQLTKVFGIERVPEPSRHLRHRSPPEYMTELYQMVAYQDGISKVASPYDADVVRGIPDKAPTKQIFYLFNLSHVSRAESILEAEFHLFKLRPPAASPPLQSSSPASPAAAAAASASAASDDRKRRRTRDVHVIDLRVYQVLRSGLDSPFRDGGPSSLFRDGGQTAMLDNDTATNGSLRLLHRRRISGHYKPGWEVFKVGDTVRQWINDSSTNHGFLVTVRSSDGRLVNGTHLRFAQRMEHHDSKQPVLIVFTDDKTKHRTTADIDLMEDEAYKPPTVDSDLRAMRQTYIKFLNEGYRAEHGTFKRRRQTYMSPLVHQRLLNSTTHPAAEQPQPQLQPQPQPQPQPRSRRSSSPADQYNRYTRRRKRTCQRQEMYVDFEKIGWSGWIISPKGYNAYHCKGVCPFPLGQNQKPSNHATVQSIVYALKIGADVDTPCCVPNKLYSISLLYFDDDENVILKQYDEMVAASCGCH